MSSVYHTSIKAIIVFIITLGEHVFIVFTCYLYRLGISMFKSTIRESKKAAGHSQPLFNYSPAITNLVFQFSLIIIIDTIMIQSVGAEKKSSLLQFFNLRPRHRELARTLCCIGRKILYICYIIVICSICKVGINKEHRINAIFLQLRCYLRIAIAPSVIEGEGYRRPRHPSIVFNHSNGLLKVHEITIFVKSFQQPGETFPINIIVVVPVNHMPI